MSVVAGDPSMTLGAETPTPHVRFPIALKLIMASAILVLLLSAGFIVAGLLSTQKQYAAFAQSRRDFEINALKTRGLATARQLAGTMYAPLLNGDIDLIGDGLQSVARGDPEFVEGMLLRKDGRIVARTGAGQLGETVSSALLNSLQALTAPALLNELSTSQALPEQLAFGSPIEVSAAGVTRREGYLHLQMTTERIRKALQVIETERKRAVRNALLQTLSIGAGALLFGIIIAVFQGFRFSGAIRHLAHVAAEVGRGNLKARARPTTRDEIGVLSVRFNEMTTRVESLLVESMAKAALDKELERANSIQRMLMPSRDAFSANRLDYCGWSETATQMGGDWWHHYRLSDDRVLLCIGDVTGHGIPSAMLTATTKACCDTILHQSSDVNFSQFMALLDHAIRESGKGQLVMTFFAALFDTKAMTVEFANAGHNFPLLVRGGKVSALVARGGRLGDGDSFQSVKTSVEPGDLIFMYTDGIIECENEQGEEYGFRRLRRILQKAPGGDILKAREALLEDAYGFYGNQNRKDDITLVLGRIGERGQS
jgi:phosphoserine phosphatase RsbU/P